MIFIWFYYYLFLSSPFLKPEGVLYNCKNSYLLIISSLTGVDTGINKMKFLFVSTLLPWKLDGSMFQVYCKCDGLTIGEWHNLIYASKFFLKEFWFQVDWGNICPAFPLQLSITIKPGKNLYAVIWELWKVNISRGRLPEIKVTLNQLQIYYFSSSGIFWRKVSSTQNLKVSTIVQTEKDYRKKHSTLGSAKENRNS